MQRLNRAGVHSSSCRQVQHVTHPVVALHCAPRQEDRTRAHGVLTYAARDPNAFLKELDTPRRCQNKSQDSKHGCLNHLHNEVTLAQLIVSPCQVEVGHHDHHERAPLTHPRLEQISRGPRAVSAFSIRVNFSLFPAGFNRFGRCGRSTNGHFWAMPLLIAPLAAARFFLRHERHRDDCTSGKPGEFANVAAVRGVPLVIWPPPGVEPYTF